MESNVGHKNFKIYLIIISIIIIIISDGVKHARHVASRSAFAWACCARGFVSIVCAAGGKSIVERLGAGFKSLKNSPANYILSRQ